jgi:integrase
VRGAKKVRHEAGRGTVTLPESTVKALGAHKAEAMQAGLLAGPVFCTRTSGYLDKKNVLRAFRGIIKNANKKADKITNETLGVKEAIPAKLRFHDLRHTVASLLLSKGCSLRAVAQRLGHSNPTITLRTCSHCMPNDGAQLARELNKMIA